jgi:hypothetical protein
VVSLKNNLHGHIEEKHQDVKNWIQFLRVFIDVLGIKAQRTPLSATEREAMRNVNECVA